MGDDEGIERKIVSRKDATVRGLKKYFTGKPCKKSGHVCERALNGNCVACKKEYDIKYSRENAEAIAAYKKEYSQENKEAIAAYKREYFQENKEAIAARHREYSQENKGRRNEYKKNRRKYDEGFRMEEMCRNMLQRTLKATKMSKTSKTYKALGYNGEDLLTHLEALFQPSMTWYNQHLWHIDHSYPVSRYIKDGEADPAVINALSNLIPMWADDNMAKGDMTLEEYLKEFPDKLALYGKFL